MKYDFSVSKICENNSCISMSSLGIPKFFEAIFTTMIGTVNTMMLSGYSSDAVSATNVATQLINLATVLMTMIVSGAVLHISIELGRRDMKKAQAFSGTGAVMCLLSSLLLGMLMFLFSDPLNGAMNLTGIQKDLADTYLKTMSLFFSITVLKTYFSNLLICNGYAKYTLLAGLLSNILNCIFGYAVLYGNLNLPVNGVSGLAVASAAAQGIGLIGVILFFCFKKCPFRLTYVRSYALRILKLGIPGGMCSLSYTLAQLITTGFIVTFGEITVNAKVYISNIVLYTQQISLALGGAGAVLIGRYRGMMRFDKIKILLKQNLVIAVLSNLSLSVAVFFLRKNLIGIFSEDTQILKISGTILLIDIAVEVARAVNHITEQGLNANADVKITFIASVASCWIFSVLFSYILGIKLGLGLVGCWIAFALDESFKAALYLIRWKSGIWQKTDI